MRASLIVQIPSFPNLIETRGLRFAISQVYQLREIARRYIGEYLNCTCDETISATFDNVDDAMYAANNIILLARERSIPVIAAIGWGTFLQAVDSYWGIEMFHARALLSQARDGEIMLTPSALEECNNPVAMSVYQRSSDPTGITQPSNRTMHANLPAPDNSLYNGILEDATVYDHRDTGMVIPLDISNTFTEDTRNIDDSRRLMDETDTMRIGHSLRYDEEVESNATSIGGSRNYYISDPICLGQLCGNGYDDLEQEIRTAL